MVIAMGLGEGLSNRICERFTNYALSVVLKKSFPLSCKFTAWDLTPYAANIPSSPVHIEFGIKTAGSEEQLHTVTWR